MFEHVLFGPSDNSVSRGCVNTLWLHLWQIPLALVTFGISLAAIGVSQLLYMVPAIILAVKRKESEKLKGLIIGASVTFLINVACTGLFFYSF
ncbi:MAG: hypothetical protein L0170_08160 [Acidobacteria bacterium]|nr:hypothetical protein [Acidobacteriota bacterium]